MRKNHNDLKTWLGPMYGATAIFARFEDGAVDSGTAVLDSSADAGTLLGDAPPAAPAEPAGPVVDAAPPATTVLDNYALVNPDGSFIEDWHSSDLLPEDLRGDDSLKVIKNLPDLAKRTVNAVKMVGKDKVVVPTDKSTPEEVAAFWETVGKKNPAMAKPGAPEEYTADIPEGMKGIFTDEKVAGIKKVAHEIGITQNQFESYLKYEMESAAASADSNAAEERRVQDEITLALKQEWGAAYDERLHVAKRLVAEAFGNSKEEELNFLQKFGNDPDFIRFSATVGSRLVEHKALVAELTNKTPTEATARIKELEATPGYMDMGSPMSDGQRQEITRQIREQYSLAYPDIKK